jgi:hypothetical protein
MRSAGVTALVDQWKTLDASSDTETLSSTLQGTTRPYPRGQETLSLRLPTAPGWFARFKSNGAARSKDAETVPRLAYLIKQTTPYAPRTVQGGLQ